MPPVKGKSKALALKHSYLGQFTKNARKVEEMKALISKQEQELSELEARSQNLKTEVSSNQNSIKKEQRKLAHKTEKLTKLTQKVKNVDLRLTMLKPTLNSASFSISQRVKKQRKLKPTSEKLSHTTKIIRRSQTFQACSAIHGVDKDLDPLITGMVDTLTSKIN